MKKLSIYILSIIMTLSLACFFACSNGDDPGETPPPALETQEAVKDFSVSTDGVISFTEQNGVTYSLLINGLNAGKVESGDDVSQLMGTTKTQLAVEKDAREGFAKSQPSNIVNVQKPQEIVLGITDLKLDFTGSSQTTYKLEVVGRDIGDVTATDDLDVSEYVKYGSNEVLIKSEGSVASDGTVILTQTSNSVNLYLHDKVDASVSIDGAIKFDERFGYTYSLSYDQTDLPINNQTDIKALLNDMAEGENAVSITITGKTEGNNVYAVRVEDKVSQVQIKKYKTPTDVKITNTNRITFDGETPMVSLFINEEYKGKVYYGESIYKYYDGKANKIAVRSESDGKGWTSELSSEVDVNLDSFLIVDFLEETKNTSLTQSDKGVTVIGTAGTTVKYSEKISLKSISADDYLIAMKPVYTGSSYGLEEVTIKLVDAYDSTKGIELVMVNGALIGAGNGTYFGGGKLGKVTDYATFSFTPVTNVLACFAGDAQADFRFKYHTEAKKFTIELQAMAGNFDYDIKSAFGIEEGENPFSEENTNLEVYLTVEYTLGSWDSGFIFESIAGNDFSVENEDNINFDNDGNWIW